MSDRLQAARDLQARIREVLLRDWDPIGVSDITEAVDEYDDYIHEIHGLLIRRESRHRLVDHLWWIETDHMALFGNRSRTEAVADRLMGLMNLAESPSSS
jgi:hypothetical protein